MNQLSTLPTIRAQVVGLLNRTDISDDVRTNLRIASIFLLTAVRIQQADDAAKDST